MANNRDQYFAAKEAKDTASNLLEKAKSFYNNLESNSYIDKLERMYRFYYGAYSENNGDGTHSITFTGEQGELVNMPVNHFRNLAQHIFVMITSTRPIMEARAVNTDYKSLSQAHLANGILDYYMRERDLETAIKKATEMSIILGAGYIKMEWDGMAGDLQDADTESGELIYDGEVKFSTASPFDIIVDGTKESWDHDWIMCRTFKNRYDIVAKYPEMKHTILDQPTKDKMGGYRYGVMSNDETDDIAIYEFYHKKTASMPEGRYMLFVGPDAVLVDTSLPYRDIPIFRIAPNEILGTTYGYTPMFDIYPIQEAINATHSAIMTNQNAFAVQNVFIKRGSDIHISSIEGGMNFIEGNERPEPLNLTQTPAEVFNHLDLLVRSAETISGVNSVARGNPQASLESGSALALVQSMSLQFISGLQQSYVKLIEDCGTSVLNILKDYATAPKVVTLVGKNNRPFLREFTGDSIQDINRVVVDMGNPLSRTIAGRVQMAEQLLQMQAIKNPEQYFQVMNTGRLDSMFEGEMNDLLLIKQENEKMMEGKVPLVSPMDHHKMHINEHRSVLANPDLREDPELVRVVMDHVEMHLNALRNTDPALLAIIQEQALGPINGTPPNPQGPPPQPGASNLGSNPAIMGAPSADILNSQGGIPIAPAEPAEMATPPAPFQDLPAGYIPPEGSGL